MCLLLWKPGGPYRSHHECSVPHDPVCCVFDWKRNQIDWSYWFVCKIFTCFRFLFRIACIACLLCAKVVGLIGAHLLGWERAESSCQFQRNLEKSEGQRNFDASDACSQKCKMYRVPVCVVSNLLHPLFIHYLILLIYYLIFLRICVLSRTILYVCVVPTGTLRSTSSKLVDGLIGTAHV